MAVYIYTSRCGPNYADAMCPRGQCCDAGGACGYGPGYCGPGHLRAWDGIPLAACPGAQYWARPADVKPQRSDGCGPLNNSFCPWDSARDLCCVQSRDYNRGDGSCQPCASTPPGQPQWRWMQGTWVLG
jgi:hypothetical protein